jgi:hypothetical protein
MTSRRPLTFAALLALATCGKRTPLGPDGSAGASAIIDAATGDVSAMAIDAATGDAATASDTASDPSGADAPAFPTIRPDGRCIENAFKMNGACVCYTYEPTACADRCTDLQVDPDNCGACGHACEREAICHAGVCGPSPAAIVLARPGACASMDLAASDDLVAWADEAKGEIGRVPLAGGALPPIALGEDHPRAIALRGRSAFWLAGPRVDATLDDKIRFISRASTLRLASLDGGEVVTVAAPPAGVDGFAVSADGATVFYSTGHTVEKIAASALATALVVARDAHAGVPLGIALDGALLAFTTDVNGDVMTAWPAAGEPSTCNLTDPTTFDEFGVRCHQVGREVNGTGTIVAGGGHIYWDDGVGIKRNVFAIDALANNDWIVSSDTRIRSIAFAGDSILLAAFDGALVDDGSIGRTSGLEPNGALVPLARHQDRPGSVVTAKGRVYWSTGDCAIRSTPWR